MPFDRGNVFGKGRKMQHLTWLRAQQLSDGDLWAWAAPGNVDLTNYLVSHALDKNTAFILGDLETGRRVDERRPEKSHLFDSTLRLIQTRLCNRTADL